MADYAMSFQTLTNESNSEHALFDIFLHSLPDKIKDQFAPLDLPFDFDSLGVLAK